MPIARAVLTATVLCLSACGASTSASAPGATGPADDAACVEIARACHGVDPGEGTAHDCHERAHATWSPAECAAHRDVCLAACAATE